MINWSEPRKPDGVNNYYDYVEFNCPVFGKFKIEWKSWKEYDTYDCWEEFIEVSANTLEEAKVEFSKQYIAAAKKMLNIAKGDMYE